MYSCRVKLLLLNERKQMVKNEDVKNLLLILHVKNLILFPVTTELCNFEYKIKFKL